MKKLRAANGAMERWRINNVSKKGKLKPIPDPQPEDGENTATCIKVSP